MFCFYRVLGGPYCRWEGLADAADYDTFETYKSNLNLVCDDGDATVMKFTPTTNTPADIFYQVYKNTIMRRERQLEF